MLPVEREESYKAEIQRLRKANETLTAQTLRLQKDNAAQAKTIRELDAFVDAEKAAAVVELRLTTSLTILLVLVLNGPAVHDAVEDEQASTARNDPGRASETDRDSEEPDVPAALVMASSNVTVRRKKRITRNASLPDLSAATIVVEQAVPLFSSTPLAAPLSPSEATRRGKRLFADESSVIIVEDSGTPTEQSNQAISKRYNLRATAARSKPSQGNPLRTQA